jgi:glyoxylase-like metal-dependent hydrolase (beta-lactamase superfamily II)
VPLEIRLLDYGDIELESSFLVLGRDCGRTRRVPVFGFLIMGGAYPILVDTGYRSNQIMETLGMRGLQFHENMIENQLARHGVRMGDVRYVAHTHLHIDHAGKDDLFPMNTTVVVNRRELEYSVSGLMHPQYPAPDIKHLIDRLHTRNALRFLDLDVTGPIELIPGVYCEAANAHTEGSMNFHVHTAEGVATICGDVVYDINDQIVEPFRQLHDAEPQTTGNHGTSKRAEKRAIKKALNNCRYLLPVHDRPAMIERGGVVGRLHDQVPGPIVQSVPKRSWFAA